MVTLVGVNTIDGIEVVDTVEVEEETFFEQVEFWAEHMAAIWEDVVAVHILVHEVA